MARQALLGREREPGQLQGALTRLGRSRAPRRRARTRPRRACGVTAGPAAALRATRRD
jgi:hypothetical protein